MNRRLLIPLTLLAALASAAPAAEAAHVAPAHGFARQALIVRFDGERHGHAVRLPDGAGVLATARALRANPAVDYAEPDYVATASGFGPSEVPNDPGPLTGTTIPGGWVEKQWNFLPWEPSTSPLVPSSPGGIDAIGAWQNLIAAGRPGAARVTIAVLDSGIAYRARGARFRRSPDFSAGQFLPGHDFVNPHGRLPLDRNGHGTHVAGTIAEKTNNGIGLTGLAYRAKLMSVRVLDANGRGRADQIAKGIRFAVIHGADVINMSFNFGCHKKVPGVAEALREAFKAGVVLVASVGNLGSEGCVSPPATIPGVIGVGGTTEGGCLGHYSLSGPDVDVVAPGGGPPISGCDSILSGPIYQVTFRNGAENRFGEPDGYVGTSMAAAHVSGLAALVLASGLIDRTPGHAAIGAQVAARLKRTARSIGLSPLQQGAGLIDAAMATDPTCQLSCFSNPR